MKRVTMSDVAQYANVSKTTVSHVINGTRYVESETKTRVLQAIDDLNYRPSRVARSLVSKQTYTVGLLLSDLDNPFYFEVIRGVEDIAVDYGYGLFLCNTNYNLDRGEKYINALIEKRVDGVLLMSSSLSLDLVKSLARYKIPTVVLDWDLDLGQSETTHYLRLNFEPGIEAAVSALIGLGHRHFAHISGPLHMWTARYRHDTFLAALAQHGIDPQSVLVSQADFQVAGGRRAFAQMIQSASHPKPTAIFAGNDLMAMGASWMAQELGYNVPKDISIVGLDNIKLSSQISPTLSTVALPHREIGNTAMTMLLEQIQNDTTASHQTVRRYLDSKFISRQSVGQAPIFVAKEVMA